jgi:Multidrug resistance efflux pump
MKVTKKKVIIGVLAVSMVVAVGFGIKRKTTKESAGVTVSTKAVEVKEIEELLSLKAPLEGTESIDVVSRLHYEILSIDVKEGDKVQKGQVLATLDTSTLEDEIEKLKDNLELLKMQYSKDEESQNTSLELAKSKLNDNLQESQRNYEQALETLKNAENDLKNAKALNEAGGISSDEVNTAQTKVNDAQREVDKFNVENGKVVATESELLDIKNSKIASSTASTLKSIEIAEKELERKRKTLKNVVLKVLLMERLPESILK